MQTLLLLLLLPMVWAKLLGGGMLGHSFMVQQNDGQVYAWGSNEYGMLGIGSNVETQLIPTKVFNVTSASDISIGGTISCIIDQNQTKCAGFGLYLGRRSTTSNSNVMLNVESLNEAVSQVFLGYAHSCVLTISGIAWCWGFAANGRLANPATASDSIPGKVSGYGADKMVIEIALGSAHTCVLLIDGTVGCAGFDAYGQLGVEDTEDRSTLTKVKGGLSNVVSISAGGTHTCTVTKQGDVYCWGSSYFGQLGLGQNVDQNAPTRKVPGIPAVAEVWCGAGQTLVILQGNRSIVGFGSNQHATLIEGGEPLYVETPATLYNGQIGIFEARGGSEAACLLLDSGQIKCLGSNDHSQLGRRTSTTQFFNPLRLVQGIIIQLPTSYDTCKPKKHTNKATCNKLIETCKQSRIVMKWFGAGCVIDGNRAFDGGCQCDGYCGFKCKLACNNNLCEWDTTLNACKIKGANATYQSIQGICPRS